MPQESILARKWRLVKILAVATDSGHRAGDGEAEGRQETGSGGEDPRYRRQGLAIARGATRCRCGREKRKRGQRGAIAWRHPDDPSLIYRGGKKPAWLTDLVASGRGAVKV